MVKVTHNLICILQDLSDIFIAITAIIVYIFLVIRSFPFPFIWLKQLIFVMVSS